METKCATLNELESEGGGGEGGGLQQGRRFKYKVPPNTVSTWLKNKDKIFAALEPHQKKVHQGENPELDETLFKWFVAKRSQKVSLDGSILNEKTRDFTKELKLTEFKASDGWLDKWKKR